MRTLRIGPVEVIERSIAVSSSVARSPTIGP